MSLSACNCPSQAATSMHAKPQGRAFFLLFPLGEWPTGLEYYDFGWPSLAGLVFARIGLGAVGTDGTSFDTLKVRLCCPLLTVSRKSLFGQMVSSLPPRLIQLAAKSVF
jgi:hypothetical protein